MITVEGEDEDIFEQWKLHGTSLPVGLQVRAPQLFGH